MGKRILIIEVNWLGDVLFSTPFIRAVRDAFPDGHIACLVHPRCAEMLEGNPGIDEIIIYDEEGLHRGLWGKMKLVMSLRRKRFDAAYILHRSFTKAIIAYLSGAGERIGYPTKNRKWLLTKAAEDQDIDIHKSDYFLNLISASGVSKKEARYEFFVTDGDRRFIDSYFSKNGISSSDKILTLCPGGNWDPKRWPKERFAELADWVALKFGMKVVITGGPKEKALADGIKALMKAPCLVSCGDTDLKELGAIFERSHLVVANDTGSMHIAVAMGSKTIALFGPTSPELTGPYGKGEYRVIKGRIECEVPCYDLTCRDNRCMKAISVEEVFAQAVDMLGEKVKAKS